MMKPYLYYYYYNYMSKCINLISLSVYMRKHRKSI